MKDKFGFGEATTWVIVPPPKVTSENSARIWLEESVQNVRRREVWRSDPPDLAPPTTVVKVIEVTRAYAGRANAEMSIGKLMNPPTEDALERVSM